MKKKSAPQLALKFTKKNALLLTVAALALSTSPAFATDTTWRDSIGNWFDPGNWDNGVPDSGTNAFINNGGTAQISADVPKALALSLTLGLNANDSGAVSVSPPHGDLIVGETIFVGYRGKGNLTITDGRSVTSATASIASLTGELWTSNGSVKVDVQPQDG